MHRKDGFSKIKGGICNISIEAANACNTLPKPAVSNGLIVVKLKRNIIYNGHVYFELVCQHIIYQAPAYFKSYNKFEADISITNSLSNEEMFNFSDIVKI